MGHWFDELTEAMALEKLSRRNAIRQALRAGLAAAAGSFGGDKALAQSGAGGVVTAPTSLLISNQGPCKVLRNSDQTTLSYTVQGKVSGKPLVLSRTETFTQQSSISHPIAPNPKTGGTPPIAPRPPARIGAALTPPPSIHLPVGIRPPVAPGSPGPSITFTETLSLGSDVVLHSDRVTSQGSTQVKVSYGSAFQGIKESSSTTNGTSVEGEIDSRQIVPFAASARPFSITFADGKPAPNVVIDPSLREAITEIFKQAAQVASSCKSAAATRASASGDEYRGTSVNSRWRSPHLSRWLKLPPVSAFAPSGLAFHSYVDSPLWMESVPAAIAVAPVPPPPPVGGDNCTNCTDSCNTGSTICDGVVAGGCILALFGYGACLAAGAAGCSVEYEECLNACDAPGGACCPVNCPAGGYCCDTAQTCVNESLNPNVICCPQQQVVCAGICCAPGIFQCNQGICCPANQSVCGGVCCPEGQTCSTEGICCPIQQAGSPPISCHGVCCAQGEVCRAEGICCPASATVCNGPQGGPTCCQGGDCDSSGNCCSPLHNGGQLCGGGCCPVFSKCCNNVCCDSFDQCINGTCCPPAQVCGGICCPSGQTCQDPKTQRCGTCAAGLTTCVPIDNPNAPICCPSGASCCAGTCCPSGQICCVDGTGAFHCHTEQVCIP